MGSGEAVPGFKPIGACYSNEKPDLYLWYEGDLLAEVMQSDVRCVYTIYHNGACRLSESHQNCH